jgi:hypothetical protein
MEEWYHSLSRATKLPSGVRFCFVGENFLPPLVIAPHVSN